MGYSNSTDVYSSYHIVMGVVAGILIWVAAYNVFDLYLKDKSDDFKKVFYTASLITGMLVLFWLAHKFPASLGYR